MMIDGDRERDDEQQHRHRRRVAHVEVAEALQVEQQRVGERRALGVAEARCAAVRRVAAPAATLDATSAWVKYCSAAITPMTTAKSSTGVMVGSVT